MPNGSSGPPDRLALAPGVRLLMIPKTGDVTVTLLGPPRGLLAHYSKLGPVYCPGNGECKSPLHKTSVNWYGYCPAEYWYVEQRPFRWKACVLEISSGLDQMMGADAIRGSVWVLSREYNKKKKSRQVGHCVELRDPDRCRDWFDVLPVLQRVYALTEIALGIKNPAPPRLVLEDRDDPAPKGFKEPPAAAEVDVPAPVNKTLDFVAEAKRRMGPMPG